MNTLLIETVNFTNAGIGTATLRNVPLDESLRLTGRFTRKDANTLLYQITVDDPAGWTKSWTAVVPLMKDNNLMHEYACHEGNHGTFGILSGTRADEVAAKQ